LIAYYLRGERDVAQIAELPKFPARPAVMENDLVYLKGINVPCAKPIDSLTDPFDEFGEPGLVIRGDRFPGLVPLGLACHRSRLAAQTDRAALKTGRDAPTPIS
jgi:hypothetical protein